MTIPLRRLLVALTALTMIVAPAAVTLPVAVADPGTTSMMLVLDASGSMAADDGSGTPKIDAARTSLTSLVNSLPTSSRVGMRVLGATVGNSEPMPSEACDDTQRVVDIDSGNQAQLISAIGHYSPYGWTPIPKALEQAGSDLGSSGKRSIVLVSDGESTCGDPCPTAESLASSGIDLTIDVIGLSVDETTRQQLQCVADKGKGKYYDTGNTDDLTKALQQTAQDRDVRPFDYSGTDVTGTSNAGSAPTVTSGYWKDTIPATGNESDTLTRYYALKRGAKQTDVAATALVASTGHEQKLSAGKKIISTELLVGSRSCGSDSDSTFGSSSYDPYFAAGVLEVRDDYSTDCRDADQLIIKVDLSNLDLTKDRSLQLKIGEWPRVGDADAQEQAAKSADKGDFEEATGKFGGSATSVQGGNSLASGPRLESNKLYQSTIVPGEMQSFTVPAGWGQSISSSVNIMPVTGEQATKLDRNYSDLPRVSTGLIGADGESHSLDYCTVDKDGCEAESSGIVDPIIYTPGSGALSDQAGDYTVTVAMADDDALAGSEFSYQLYVQTVGEILPPPNYQTVEEAQNAPTTSPSPSKSKSAGSTSSPAAKAPARHGLLAAGLGSAGVLLVAGGGAAIWYTTRRRH